MKRLDIRIFVAAAVSVAALLTAGPVLSQDNGSRVSSELMFTVETDNLGIFPVVTEANVPETISYDLANATVQFSAGILATGVYDDPLFCFDDSDDAGSGVKLRIFDPNGHLVAENVGVSGSLRYFLNDNEISIAPSSTAQCFYRNLDKNEDGVREFGLFGQAPQTDDESEPDPQAIFGDRFSAFPQLSVSYSSDMPTSVSTGDPLTYTLSVHNSGKVTASGVSLQEVFPSNSSVYNATLIDEGWNCFDGGSGACPETSSGSGPLRLTGLEIPPDATANFEITRLVPVDDVLAGHSIHLHAGVVTGVGSLARFDVAEHTLDVMGEPAALEFAEGPWDTPIGEIMDPVVIHVVDANGNRVETDNETEVKVELRHNGNYKWDLTSWESVSAGRIEFSELSMGDVSPDTGYTLVARAGTTLSPRESDPFEVTQPDS